jgi:hypothetical protein
MTLAMQEVLLSIDDLDQRVNHAKFALEALGEHLCSFRADERELSLQSSTAIYKDEPDAMCIVQDIGIRGELEDISYIQLPGMPFGLSLGVNSYETFTPNDPNNSEPSRIIFHAPITGVQYVELAA